MPKFKSGQLSWLWLSLVVLVVDVLSKRMAVALLSRMMPTHVLPGIQLILTHNKGASYGFLADATGWQRWLFSGLAVLVSLGILVWLRALPKNDRLTTVGLCLILGGAIGNVLDRLIFGYVVDFITLNIGRIVPFGVFNVADMAITFGVLLLIVASFRRSKR